MTDITQHHEQLMVTENDARLRQASDGLAWIEGAANNEAAELERLIAASRENEAILQTRIGQARTVIADAQTRAQPNIDDVVCAETVVYNQLYDLVTEDSAIEDTIYVLSKALENDRINLDTFLKVGLVTKCAIVFMALLTIENLAYTDSGERTVYEESAGSEDYDSCWTCIAIYLK